MTKAFGESYSRLYRVWRAMKARCQNPNHVGYERYGAKGIKVCKEWQEYAPFRNWSMAHGYAENLTIDRINNKGNYDPENCRYVTLRQNISSRKGTVRWWLKYGYTLQEIADHMHVTRGRAWQLAKMNSKRIGMAVRDLEMGEKLAARALRETGTDVKKRKA